jgi:hypothetical protein
MLLHRQPSPHREFEVLRRPLQQSGTHALLAASWLQDDTDLARWSGWWPSQGGVLTARCACLRHHDEMSGNAAPGSRRPGWVWDVSAPHALDELRGSLQGSVGLPARLFWSGPNPRDVRWDLANSIRRRDLYEIVLVGKALWTTYVN